jgi:hypothetical protein
MDNERVYRKLEELSLGQQRIELKLEAHLDEHKLSFKRLTQVYIPTIALAFTAISGISWFGGHRH